MTTLHGRIYENGKLREGTFAVGVSVPFSDNIIKLPGLADVHVHFREPGFSYKETVATGSAAAARGGFTALCAMPNLDPVPDCASSLGIQLELIRKQATVRVIPYGAITVGEAGKELSDMESLAPYVCAFSDDGRGVCDSEVMRRAMLKAKSLGKPIAAHCEDMSYPRGSAESEWRQIERDLALARETGAAYHVCHISARESVELIRRAKREGLDVTCETAPHYLAFCDKDVIDSGRFRMNPPLRSESDRDALLGGIADGTVDMIATDHAPHSADEKSRGFADSLSGVVGLETAFAAMYTHLVKKGVITLEKLISLMSDNPRRRFGIEENGYTVFDLGAEYTVDPEVFLSKGRSTPFDGERLFGKCIETYCGGKKVW